MSEEREQYTVTPALDLDAIEARCNAATPGPWLYADTVDMASAVQARGDTICEFYGLQDRIDRDAQFIAHARTDEPALVAEVHRLRAVTHAQAQELDRFTLTADEDDVIENLILRLRRTMSDGELYGIDEQEAQMRYMLRSTFASIMADVRILRGALDECKRYEIIAIGNAADLELRAHINRQEIIKLRADIDRIGRERDDMARANAELQARLSAHEDDGK